MSRFICSFLMATCITVTNEILKVFVIIMMRKLFYEIYGCITCVNARSTDVLDVKVRLSFNGWLSAIKHKTSEHNGSYRVTQQARCPQKFPAKRLLLEIQLSHPQSQHPKRRKREVAYLLLFSLMHNENGN